VHAAIKAERTPREFGTLAPKIGGSVTCHLGLVSAMPVLTIPSLLTEKAAARFLSVSPGTLREWRVRRRGHGVILPFHRVGRAIRYDPADLRAFLAQARQEADFPREPRSAARGVA